jgi:uncharacterized membrane protein YcaP (DUF421 family)
MIPDWHAFVVNMVELGTSNLQVSVLEKALRPALVYFLLVFLLRRFGKRMLAQLNPFDLVVLLMLSNTVQNAIIGNDTSLTGGVLGAAALLATNTVLVRWYYRGPKEEHQVMADADEYLIKNYTLQEDALVRLKINVGELTARAHERGFDTIEEVESAVIYPNGTIYVKGASVDSERIKAILEGIEGLRRDLGDLRRGAQA